MSLRFLPVGRVVSSSDRGLGSPNGCAGRAAARLLPEPGPRVRGFTRTYDVQVPASYDGSADVPLVVDLHGWTRTKEWQESQVRLRGALPDRGLHRRMAQEWDTRPGTRAPCAPRIRPSTTSGSSVPWFGDRRAEQGGPGRIYATGQSCGGAMTHRLACDAADLFAAAAEFSWPEPLVACAPARAIPILMTHSLDDAYVPYLGGHIQTTPTCLSSPRYAKASTGGAHATAAPRRAQRSPSIRAPPACASATRPATPGRGPALQRPHRPERPLRPLRLLPPHARRLRRAGVGLGLPHAHQHGQRRRRQSGTPGGQLPLRGERRSSGWRRATESGDACDN